MSNGDSSYVFRRLSPAELDAGYSCLLDTCAWLEQRRIRQWLKPLPREIYARRHAQGENFGLFRGNHLVSIVSLIQGVPGYWHDLVSDPTAIWLATLAVLTPGRGLGVRTVQAAIEVLTRDNRPLVYLDCRTGVLETFYRNCGFQRLAIRSFQPTPDFAYEAALMRHNGPSVPPPPSPGTADRRHDSVGGF